MGHAHGERHDPGALTSEPVDPADPDQLRLLLRRAQVRPRHSLGQNFLVDPALRDRLVELSGITPADRVLEVGAGAGGMTVALAGRSEHLVAVELDRRLAALLRRLLGRRPDVEIVEANILDLDVARWFPEGGHVVAGNVPYYLTGALLRRLLEQRPRPRLLSLVVQKEVAERWLGTLGWSLATVVVHTLAEAHLEFALPARAFYPAPKVDSALVRLQVRAEPAVGEDELGAFFRFSERIFQFRRKQLQAAVAQAAGMASSSAARRLRGLGIDPSRRAETLGLEAWQALFAEFRQDLGAGG